MNELGVEVAWEAMDYGPLIERLSHNRPLMWADGVDALYPDPQSFSVLAVSTGWRNERYLALLDEARRTADQATRLALYRQADRIVIADSPILSCFYRITHSLSSPRHQAILASLLLLALALKVAASGGARCSGCSTARPATSAPGWSWLNGWSV